MDLLHVSCAGLEVHKGTVVACVRRLDAKGQVQQQTRTFGTMTSQLLELGDWLAEQGVTHGAMGHLASWTGICSGNRESAGKRQSGKTTKGNRWLRATLVQVARAASHTKGTYLSAQYRRLAGRRGKKRALVALGHTLLVIMYHLLKQRTTYQELGGDFLERLEPERLTRQLVQRLEKLGHDVTLRPKEDAA